MPLLAGCSATVPSQSANAGDFGSLEQTAMPGPVPSLPAVNSAALGPHQGVANLILVPVDKLFPRAVVEQFRHERAALVV